MITKDNFKQALLSMNFEETEPGVFIKRYKGQRTFQMKADFNQERLEYAEGITIGRATTSNFSDNENFVVFECVDRLLVKGYKPEDIELEPEWKIGHTQKGGYADIWVRTHNSLFGDMVTEKESLLIIECKKADEFDDAWKDTLEDGAQLFSYFQQEQATKFLCLYTSDLEGKDIKPDYYLINVQDNEKLLQSSTDAKSFKDASNNKQLYSVWHDTYGCESSKLGLFEDDIQPYNIGKYKFTVKDLTPIGNEEIKKKYNEFATILRQHNVGAKENAFDKLVNLFLAKVVDETNNPDDLHFYWRGAAYDDDFSLQDRLQRLYRDGMERFLNETVTYIENDEIEKAFRWYKKDPDATMKTVMGYFRALKFFSDNDFSFISVHNERLFKENAIILRKVLLMLENIRLKSTGKDTDTNQFLGDLFEGFLTKGVKQSEGQYFTPMPIVRFIVSSLPLEQIVSRSEDIPSCIDYACGAGHFLTEYAVRIREFVEKHRPEIDIHEYYKQITGIEKEYRLSKVSKVSAFMYGHDETNIVYADALKPHKDLQPQSYDVLVANPPYSVTGFLDTLSDADRQKFSLYESSMNVSKNNAIETFFMERAAQLMKAGGVAGIVLPVSILNKGGIYARARQIILETFDIVALAEFGSGTFGKTGTNTVVLFLRRKETNTPAAEHYRNRVKTWFASGDNANDIYEDEVLLKAYCTHCGYDIDDYKEFLTNGTICDRLSKTEVFSGYAESFDSTSKTAMKGVCDKAKAIRARFNARRTTKTFKALPEALKAKEKENAINAFAREIEKEKVYLFLLVYTVRQPVLIAKSPLSKNGESNKEIKKFLGYEWSDSKGNEGIQYLHIKNNSNSEDEDNGDAADDDTMQQIRGINGIVTPLFNPSDLSDSNKINTLIRQNFLGEDVVVPEELSRYVSQAMLTDMIDFKRTAFDKEIKRTTTLVNKDDFKEFNSTIVKELGNIAPIVSERISFKDIKAAEYITTDNMLQNFGGVTPYEGSAMSDSVTKYQKGDILMSNIRPYLKKIWLADRDGGCSPDVIVFRPQSNIAPKFLSTYLQRQIFIDFVMFDNKGVKMPRGNKNTIVKFPITCPPLSVQQQIVSECEAVDKEVSAAREEIDTANKEIEQLFLDATKEAAMPLNLSDSHVFSLSIGRRVVSNEVVENGKYKVVSANVNDEFGRINHSVLDDFSVPSVLWGIDGDWMVSYIEKEVLFAPTDHCGVVRVLDEQKVLPKYLVYPPYEGRRRRTLLTCQPCFYRTCKENNY